MLYPTELRAHTRTQWVLTLMIRATMAKHDQDEEV